MLTIKDNSGLDLVANPLVEQKFFVDAGMNTSVSVILNAIEDDATLVTQKVSGTLNWNDGSYQTVYNGNGTVAVVVSKGLPVGTYVLNFTAQNYRRPVPDVVAVNIPVVVESKDAKAAPRRFVYGPILPRDTGVPNAQSWNFDTKDGLLILESSVKMLLITSKGERICEPEYGTNLRRILFEQSVAGIDQQVSEEIVSALTTWEPRVQLAAVSVSRDANSRAITVNAQLISALSQQTFDVNLEFVR